MLADAGTKSGITFAAEIGGVINGSVTEMGSGDPVTTFSLRIAHANDPTFNYYVGGFIDNVTGDYSLRGLPDGEYYLYLDPLDDNRHIPEVYGAGQCNSCYGLISEGLGTELEIIGANTINNINFNVEMGASISGFLIDQIDLQPHYEFGLIMVFDALNYNLAHVFVEGNLATPAGNGSYTVGGLMPGNYYVQGGDRGTQFY